MSKRKLVAPAGSTARVVAALRVKFDFRYVTRDSKKACERSDKKAGIDAKLKEYGELTFKEFRQHGGVRFKYVKHTRPPITKPPNLSSDISPLLYSFRISGKIRIFGYTKDNSFFVRVIDLNHTRT